MNTWDTSVLSGATARLLYPRLKSLLNSRNKRTWQKHDVVKVCGIGLRAAGELVRCADEPG
jgi:hypothetical protein